MHLSRALSLVTVVALLAAWAVTPAPEPPPAGGPSPRAAMATPSQEGATSRPEAPATLVMWARGGLPAVVADRAARLPGVEVATHVRSETLALVGAWRADGTAAAELDEGWRIPVEVVAVEPRAAARTLAAGADRDALAALQPGEALLPASSSERRGVGPGGRLALLGGTHLRVAGLVDDATLGGTEVIVHAADAGALGMEDDGSLLLAHDDRRDPSFVAQLESLAPTGTRVRVTGARPDEEPRRASLVLGLDEVKARFGEFAFRDDDPDREIWPTPTWVAASITVESVPILGRVRCHRDVLDDLHAALHEVVDAGLAAEIDPSEYGGCFHPRRIGGGTESLSRHSWGIAIDLNVDFTEPGMGAPPDPRVIAILARHGFQWGGEFLSPDNHHFEWAGDRATTDPPPAGTGETRVEAAA